MIKQFNIQSQQFLFGGVIQFYLIRHGSDDFKTGSLSDIGRQQIRDAARFLTKPIGVNRQDVILLSSPVKYAGESAQLIQAELGLADFHYFNALMNNPNLCQDLLNYSAAHSQFKTIVAVSHMPEIEKAVERFADRFCYIFNAFADRGTVHFIDTEANKIECVFTP